MKAVQLHRYGPPDVLELVGDAPPPTPGDGEVLVRLVASSVNPVDWHTMRGRPLLTRLSMGLTRPRAAGIGADLAGIVETIGPGVTSVRRGDEVFGMGRHAWAELVTVNAEGVVTKPTNLSWEEAGCVGVAALTALQGIRDKGRVGPGDRVLVNGAGGGVGHYAVQIAKALGAEVVAATGPANLEMVRSLGADEVVDYTAVDATRSGRPFDVIFDAGGWLSLRQLRRGLRPGGVAVLAGTGPRANLAAILARLVGARLLSRIDSRKYVSYLAHRAHDDLDELTRMLRAGTLRPVIDRTYAMADIRDAVRYQESGRAIGKVGITVVIPISSTLPPISTDFAPSRPADTMDGALRESRWTS